MNARRYRYLDARWMFWGYVRNMFLHRFAGAEEAVALRRLRAVYCRMTGRTCSSAAECILDIDPNEYK